MRAVFSKIQHSRAILTPDKLSLPDNRPGHCHLARRSRTEPCVPAGCQTGILFSASVRFDRQGHFCYTFPVLLKKLFIILGEMTMLSEESIIEQLNQAGYRITQPRRAVIRAILEDDGFSNPIQVHERARAHCPTLGLVTVYRTLDLLAALGFVRRIHTDDGCHGYAAASRGHHHHLTCQRCGATVEFEGCDLSELLARVSQETGYTIENHLLTLVGLCSMCR